MAIEIMSEPSCFCYVVSLPVEMCSISTCRGGPREVGLLFFRRSRIPGRRLPRSLAKRYRHGSALHQSAEMQRDTLNVAMPPPPPNPCRPRPRPPQATFFKTPCPTERGACLEITLVSEGGRGARDNITAASDTESTAISLYAVQAPHRPLRLSSYQWASRGKTHHKLGLHWKGGSPSSSQRSGERGHGYPGTRTHTSHSCTVVPPPWGGVTGHAPPNPATVNASAFATLPAPIHIAVVCPEAPPPFAVPVAPAFDGSRSDLLAEDEHEERDAHRRGRGVVDLDAEADLALGGVLGKTAADAGAGERGRGMTAAARRSGRIRFFVGVRVLGPPRVVLEGR